MHSGSRTTRMIRRSALERPLFEEPSSACERPDPWTGPKGFMFGGMALPTKLELGHQYYEAASLLVDAIKRDELEDYRLANPVLYLYRHWLELALKSLIGTDAHGHDLGQLASEFESTMRGTTGSVLPSWIARRVKEVAAIDPNSTAFRYAENRDRITKRDVPVDGEIYVNLNHLREAMEALHLVFVNLANGSDGHQFVVVEEEDEEADWWLSNSFQENSD